MKEVREITVLLPLSWYYESSLKSSEKGLKEKVYVQHFCCCCCCTTHIIIYYFVLYVPERLKKMRETVSETLYERKLLSLVRIPKERRKKCFIKWWLNGKLCLCAWRRFLSSYHVHKYLLFKYYSLQIYFLYIQASFFSLSWTHDILSGKAKI